MGDLLTERQISRIFNINPITLKKLMREGKIPFTKNEDSRRPLFDMDAMSRWVADNPLIEEEEVYLNKIQAEWRGKSPELFAALQAMDVKVIAHSDAQKEPRRYSLMKRPSKKHGFLYYVRYIDNGRLVPSKWNTRANTLQEAEKFAVENRARILREYYAKHAAKSAEGGLYEILEEYYKAGSPYLEKDKNRCRVLCEKTRSVYDHFMTEQFIPFLQKSDVKTFHDINPPVIANFQDYLLSKGIRPQSINRYLSGVNCAFNHLLTTGVIKENAFDRVKALKMGAESIEARGCHDIDKMKGVFNAEWEDSLSYMLCLIIYSTGMRNSEIEKMKEKDLVELDGTRFVDIKGSKTKNGARLAPLHDFVYKKIKTYIEQTGKRNENYIFSIHGGPNQSTTYKNANILLGKKLRPSDNETEIEKELERQNISFYSGRHFWKTLMSGEGLGDDIEEFFMGHKVSGDVSKNYNHKDKQGRGKLLEKAREVFAILDKKLLS
jgi:integrase